ncbi:MAG: YjjG family noncanonical pyrimidine nucleotidase [Bacteroidales bacterium]|nr:YjjG family noncanonical pyrimidine nucleotidase [Bacteroidales bacterium]
MKYKSIFIDLDDTLWDTRANSKESMSEVYEKYKLAQWFPSFEFYYKIYSKKNLELWNLYHFGKITKQELTKERFLFPLLQVGVKDEDLARNLGYDFLMGTATKTKLVKNAIELLDYLSPKYRLFILSNGFREVQFKKIDNSGLSPYFEKVIVSEDAGANKPHPDIYHYALKSTNSRKNESIMIGDNPETDIAGAYNLKIDQIYFANNQEIELDFQPNYVVNSLLEIKDIL